MTMALLVQSAWFEGEAEALGIEVSDAKVERVLRRTKRQAFRSERDYRRFLRATGMTEADVLFRLRIQELTAAITRHVLRGAGRDGGRRLEAFAREFERRWSERTACRAGFVVRPLCGDAAGGRDDVRGVAP